MKTRNITGETFFEKKYGDEIFDLNAGTEKATAADHFRYQIAYDAYQTAYPDLPATVAVGENGKVSIKMQVRRL